MATPTVKHDPIAQKNDRDNIQYDRTPDGRNSANRVVDCGAPPMPKPTKQRKAMIQ